MRCHACMVARMSVPWQVLAMTARALSASKRVPSAIAQMATRGLIDSRRLFYFFHVAKHGSFSVAEARLDVAQPVMTRQIQQLEADIGARLLERTGRGVTLTVQGQILNRHAESIFNGMAAAMEEVELSRRRPTARLSIAASAVFSSMVMPEVIRRLLTRMPDIELTVLEASTGQVHEYLSSGQVDLAVVLHAPKIVHANHVLARASFVSRDQVAQLELIMPSGSHGSRRLMDEYFDEAALAPVASLKIDSLVITKALIGQGPRFASMLPERSVREEVAAGHLVAIAMRPALHRTLYLARLRDRPLTPCIQEMTEQIASVVRDRQIASLQARHGRENASPG